MVNVFFVEMTMMDDGQSEGATTDGKRAIVKVCRGWIVDFRFQQAGALHRAQSIIKEASMKQGEGYR